MARLTVVKPHDDAWGDDPHVLYLDGFRLAENSLADGMVEALIENEFGQEASGDLMSMDRISVSDAVEVFTNRGIEVDHVVCDTEWLGRVGDFPAELAAVQAYDPDAEE